MLGAKLKPIKIPPDGGILIGATEQNLLKLFEKLVDGQISNIPTIVPSISESKERVIY